jgi:site-specific DNA recombinase
MAELELIPAHLIGRRLVVLPDPKETLAQRNVEVGGYIRISTKKDSQLTSIENQQKLIAQWAEVNKYRLLRFYVDVKSGEYIYLRNEINQLLEDMRRGKIKGIVSKEISRTGRDIMDILELKRQITSYGGFFISIKEGYDSRTDDDEFLLVLHGALAQKERQTTANRVKVTQIIKAREGKTNVPHPAFGYMLGKDRQHLAVNPETAPVYRLIVAKFLEGWGQLKIAKYLNASGIPSKRGRQWGNNAIKTILSNPVYLGVTIYNTTTLIRDPSGRQKRVMRPREDWIVRERTHEPLITEEEFAMIQQLMSKRREQGAKEWTCDRKYLGSSILRCTECGGKIYGSRYPKKANRQKNKEQYYYRYCCQGRNGQCSYPMKYWEMGSTDRLIMELFRGIFADRQKLLETIKGQTDFFQEDNVRVS